MIRLFLTLLALLTGVVAQLTPAQARSIGASEVAVEIARSDARLVERRVVSVLPAATTGRRADDCTIQMLKRVPDCAPTVLMGIDRARE